MGLLLSHADLPALHDAASVSSQRAQEIYLRLMGADLGAVVVGAALTAASFQRQGTLQFVACAGALLLVAGLIITAIISLNNYEQRWYGGRAVAESVKTLAWRYVTGADPFKAKLAARAADAEFVRQLQEILAQSDKLAIQFGGIAGTKEQITSAMRQVRAASVNDRKTVYLRDRVGDQRSWYSSKAAASATRESRFFIWIIVCQFASVAAAVYMVARPSSAVNFTGLLATLSAALLAWLQVKRHQELSQSYSIAAHELGLIAEQAQHLRTEDEFAAFVADAEAAISREHTLWVARRDVPSIASLNRSN